MTDAEMSRLLAKLAGRPVGRLHWRIARIVGLWLVGFALARWWDVPIVVAMLLAGAAVFGPYFGWLYGRWAEVARCEAKHPQQITHRATRA